MFGLSSLRPNAATLQDPCPLKDVLLQCVLLTRFSRVLTGADANRCALVCGADANRLADMGRRGFASC